MAKYLEIKNGARIIQTIPPEYFPNLNVKPIQIRYKNWKGEIGVRKIFPDEVWFGSTEYHPEPQFLLKAWDVDKKAMRDFVVLDILEFIKE